MVKLHIIYIYFVIRKYNFTFFSGFFKYRYRLLNIDYLVIL